jgi:two-component system NtrC family sensor kinase
MTEQMPTPASQLPQGTVLIVDDNRINRTVLASRFAKRGFEVGQAEDGEAALNAIDQRHFDLVLLDIEMPGLNGFDVLRKLRERFSRAELPVVMITGREGSSDVVEALGIGANDYVFKSADFAVVLARVVGQLELKQALEQLQQDRRLQSVGELAGGLAHEVNTPLQFISDNATFIQHAFERIQPLLDACERMQTGSATPADVDLGRLIRRCKLPMVREQLPKASSEILAGVGRVSDIVEAMRSFAAPSGEADWSPLRQAIEATVTIAGSAWRPVAEVSTDLDDAADQLRIDRHQLNQVVLALLVNAAQAIEQRYPAVDNEDAAREGRISISARRHEDRLEVVVSDNGPGVDPEIRDRIFDPFFTTRAVGSGRGQGLALCQAIIVKGLGGKIELTSEPNQGATFALQIPFESEGFFAP